MSTKQPQTKNYGFHLILDCYEANPRTLGSVHKLYAFLDTLPKKIGMQKIGPPHIAKIDDEEIAGLTGIVMIITSHISIHTYSKKGCFFLDIFSCNDFDPKGVKDHVQQFFDVTRIDAHEVTRGKHFPVDNIHP